MLGHKPDFNFECKTFSTVLPSFFANNYTSKAPILEG